MRKQFSVKYVNNTFDVSKKEGKVSTEDIKLVNNIVERVINF